MADNGASLFNQPKTSVAGGGGGDYWPGRAGSFRGRLLGFSEGPVFKNERKNPQTGETEEFDNPQIRWEFAVSSLTSGKAVTYENANGDTLEATIDGLSSKSITNLSKAGEWFTAILRREIDFDNETREDLCAEAIGGECLLVLVDNGKRIRVKTVARLDD